MVDLVGGFYIVARDYGFQLCRRELTAERDGVKMYATSTIGHFHSFHDCVAEITLQLEREAVKNSDMTSIEVFLDKLSFLEKTWAERAKNSLLVDVTERGTSEREKDQKS